MAIAYLIYKENMTFDAALAFLQAKDPLIAPNAAFVAQLRSFEAAQRAKAPANPPPGAS